MLLDLLPLFDSEETGGAVDRRPPHWRHVPARLEPVKVRRRTRTSVGVFCGHTLTLRATSVTGLAVTSPPHPTVVRTRTRTRARVETGVTTRTRVTSPTELRVTTDRDRDLPLLLLIAAASLEGVNT